MRQVTQLPRYAFLRGQGVAPDAAVELANMDEAEAIDERDSTIPVLQSGPPAAQSMRNANCLSVFQVASDCMGDPEFWTNPHWQPGNGAR